ncbi:MAG: 16S rRNA (guanine(527)-N(7))-methyltransferase RsmG [Methyloceanibacter sp.]
MTPGEFAAHCAVSRETLATLELYSGLLRKWQKRVNLVSRDSLQDLWRRHFLDSAQLYPLLPQGARTLLDLGSGAGFPGLVLAVMGVPKVHLVEADRRKCIFLREAARVMNAKVEIHCGRIEKLKPWPVDVITARAVAPLGRFLDLVEPFLEATTCCIVLKGASAERELAEARRLWNISARMAPSKSDPSGRIVVLSSVTRDATS